VDLHFKPRGISDSLISTLRNVYYYTGRWGLSVKNFTGEHWEYWEELPARLRIAKDSPKMMKQIIEELEGLKKESEKRKAKRRRLVKTNGFQKKEVVINEQLLAILAALPKKMLSDVFRKLTAQTALPEKAELLDMHLGTGEQLIEPDFLLGGDRQLIMGELKVNARQGNNETKYPAYQLFNYLSLATKCLSSRHENLPDRFAHMIILPRVDLKWFDEGSKWITDLEAGSDHHMEFDIEATYSLAEGRRKQRYVTDKNKLRILLSSVLLQ
jgi:hypothetical protein